MDEQIYTDTQRAFSGQQLDAPIATLSTAQVAERLLAGVLLIEGDRLVINPIFKSAETRRARFLDPMGCRQSCI